MKNLKLFVLALGLFTLNLSAANLNPIKATDELRSEMIELIGSNFMDEMLEDQYEANVLFTVNANKELIVLSVESDNDQLENYLKRRLNYKKVNHKPTKYGEIYLLPVKMIKQI
ncbi:hypothetical protein LCM02_06765 [Lutimonas saemankumensis]|uniref:hypothetical protein n=1 Tax=Lutimonas saemankumensis TaxID=483016 RepID=UPI001CD7BC3C|nr:hypothetical protein [Lutimonas saemankumensis]MCA0932147.1 hypothetical protein [Lutimonas saemankumensis]